MGTVLCFASYGNSQCLDAAPSITYTQSLEWKQQQSVLMTCVMCCVAYSKTSLQGHSIQQQCVTRTKFLRTESVYAAVTTLVTITMRYKDKNLGDRGSRYNKVLLYIKHDGTNKYQQ